jgi:hypothetical protein
MSKQILCWKWALLAAPVLLESILSRLIYAGNGRYWRQQSRRVESKPAMSRIISCQTWRYWRQQCRCVEPMMSQLTWCRRWPLLGPPVLLCRVCNSTRAPGESPQSGCMERITFSAYLVAGGHELLAFQRPIGTFYLIYSLQRLDTVLNLIAQRKVRLPNFPATLKSRRLPLIYCIPSKFPKILFVIFRYFS